MRLDDLLRGTREVTRVTGDTSVDVRDLAYDSRRVGPGSLFFAVPGVHVDGASFADEAAKRGAIAVVGPAGSAPGRNGVFVEVGDVRKAMAGMAARFFGHPSRALKLIGVTGTNGKTTFTYLMESILQQAGFRPGVVGTVNCRYGGRSWQTGNTTPESVDLQRTFRDMSGDGVTHVFLEVSSHGLDYRRVDGCDFSGAVFTMLGRDHLDHHGDAETYFRAKARLFTEILPASAVPGPWAVINRDDPHGQRLVEMCPLPVRTVSGKGTADYSIETASFGRSGTLLKLATPKGSLDLKSRLLGEVNAANILLAAAAADLLDVKAEAIERGILAAERIPGRLERVFEKDGLLILVDYAHTPDALDRVLAGLRGLTPGRLITVFGCGGDRDRGKRPLMGGSAARWSDLVVVTSDNPRSESPKRIMEEIREGIEALHVPCVDPDAISNTGKVNKAYCLVEDRRSAIRLAVRAAKSGDTVVIAGKGHEAVQIIGSRRIPFRDDEEVLGALGDTGARE